MTSVKIKKTGEELEPFELLIDGKHIGYYDTRQEAKDAAAAKLGSMTDLFPRCPNCGEPMEESDLRAVAASLGLPKPPRGSRGMAYRA